MAREDKFFGGLKADLRDIITTSPQNTFIEVHDDATNSQGISMDYYKS